MNCLSPEFYISWLCDIDIDSKFMIFDAFGEDEERGRWETSKNLLGWVGNVNEARGRGEKDPRKML